VKKILWPILDAAEPDTVWDNSCFVRASRAAFTIVDFALWDGVDNFSEPPERSEHLSDQQRSELDAFARVDDSSNGRTQAPADN
jgi:hypothetical protein